jgi:hypothetical protein
MYKKYLFFFYLYKVFKLYKYIGNSLKNLNE